jgi:YHS domain-containing protein
MTVAASAASLRAEHAGITYYFCCAGCRRTFEDNPDDYVKAVLR